MNDLVFYIFIAAGAYFIIGEALFRVRRNTKRGKHAEEFFGVKGFRIMNLIFGAISLAVAFIFYRPF